MCKYENDQFKTAEKNWEHNIFSRHSRAANSVVSVWIGPKFEPKNIVGSEILEQNRAKVNFIFCHYKHLRPISIWII